MTEVYEIKSQPPEFDKDKEAEEVKDVEDNNIDIKELINDITPPPSLQPEQIENIESYKPSLSLEEKNIILAKLTAYNELFGDSHLKNVNLRNISHKTDEELIILLDRCKFVLNTRGGFNSAHSAFMATIGVSEVLGQKVGLKLSGLSQAMANNADVKEIVNEICVDMLEMYNLGPMQRLALVTAQTAMTIHLINCQHEKQISIYQQQRPAKPEEEAKPEAKPAEESKPAAEDKPEEKPAELTKKEEEIIKDL